ncbi:MAG TPA: DsrE family protein [Methylophilus sp.]|nr:DsrE family protein [Methylophilus sp.]
MYFKQKGTEVAVYFQGTGTRWAGIISQEDHALYALYSAVSDTIAGVSCGCADAFGAREEAVKNGFDLITDNSVPGTSGLTSITQLSADGYAIFTF